jgi:hypothetical protein
VRGAQRLDRMPILSHVTSHNLAFLPHNKLGEGEGAKLGEGEKAKLRSVVGQKLELCSSFRYCKTDKALHHKFGHTALLLYYFMLISPNVGC